MGTVQEDINKMQGIKKVIVDICKVVRNTIETSDTYSFEEIPDRVSDAINKSHNDGREQEIKVAITEGLRMAWGYTPEDDQVQQYIEYFMADEAEYGTPYAWYRFMDVVRYTDTYPSDN